MASAVAWRLYMANLRRIVMLEIENPLAVRREVSFCEAVQDGEKDVEGVKATLVKNPAEVRQCWENDAIAVLVDPQWQSLNHLNVNVSVDAILAKKNMGTKMDDAELVLGLGPGFTAGQDVHYVIETNRGHNLGRIITSGSAEPNTGIPGSIQGFAEERIFRAPGDGLFQARKQIGDSVSQDDILGAVEELKIKAGIDGIVRGLIRSGSNVKNGLKLEDIDPRGDKSYCYTISDKARAIAGSVLEGILRVFNAECGMRKAEIRYPDPNRGAD